MNKLKLAFLAGVAVVGSGALTDSANAQIYSGGSTLASKVYRQLFDCWGLPANTSIIAVSPSCTTPTGNVGGFSVQILYAPVGSGAGKRAFENHDGSTSTSTGLGTPSASNTIPYTSTLLPAFGYPNLHFAGSDDVLSQTDVTNYNGLGDPVKFGAILQLPAFATTVAIPFNGKDGTGAALSISNAPPAGGSSGLNLSRQAVCGIFSGHITKWNNPILTALNGGTALGTGTITVVHRSDGSGTTFLTTNALVAQCAGVVGPNSETDPSIALYSFNYTDRGVSTAQCNNAIPVEGANTINWPDLVNDQCSQPIASRNPGGGTYASASGSGGVVNLVTSTNGAITYVSPDFVQPIVSTGLKTANLQSQYDVDNNTGLFQPPTAAGAATAMSAANPTFDPTSAVGPINWSRQGVVPNPLLPSSYPIAGFTWLDFYQCYKAADQTYTPIFQYLVYHYTDASAQNILRSNGFSPIPSAWLNFVGYLLTASSNPMGNGGGGACTGHNGA